MSGRLGVAGWRGVGGVLGIAGWAAGARASGADGDGARGLSGRLDAFVRSAPRLQRTGLRVLLALARRPRGARMLARMPAADKAAHATLSMVRYDDDAVARTLGWDAAAVVARGRELRAVRG